MIRGWSALALERGVRLLFAHSGIRRASIFFPPSFLAILFGELGEEFFRRFLDLKFFEEETEERRLVVGSALALLLALVAQALEVRARDLQTVHEQRSFFRRDEVVGQGAHDAVERELEAGGVFDCGEDELGARLDLAMKAADLLSAEGRLAAGLAGHELVGAAGHEVGVGL